MPPTAYEVLTYLNPRSSIARSPGTVNTATMLRFYADGRVAVYAAGGRHYVCRPRISMETALQYCAVHGLPIEEAHV